MTRRAMMVGVLVLLGAVVAVGASVDGRWTGTISGPNGDFDITFNFKADGNKLTGTVETPNGDQPISDGKIDGDKISFKTHFQDNDIDHDGTVSGDTIQLKVKGPWGETDMTLKRAAEKGDKKTDP